AVAALVPCFWRVRHLRPCGARMQPGTATGNHSPQFLQASAETGSLLAPSKVTGYRIPVQEETTYMKRMAWLMIPVLAAALAAPAAAAPYDTFPPSYVSARHEITPVAQGLTLTHFERLYPHGWVNGWLLTAD